MSSIMYLLQEEITIPASFESCNQERIFTINLGIYSDAEIARHHFSLWRKRSPVISTEKKVGILTPIQINKRTESHVGSNKEIRLS